MLHFDKLIHCIDVHVGGEPLRIVRDGFPKIPGGTMMAKREYAMQHLDWLRKLVMFEPRGHNDMYGCIPTEPVTEDGDLGVLFMHAEGFSTMCGHGIMGSVHALAETGALFVDEGENEINVDTPAGRVKVKLLYENKRVSEVRMENVYSFAYKTGIPVTLASKTVLVDVAFGGSFFAFVDAEKLGIDVTPENLRALLLAGNEIRHTLSKTLDITHPENPGIRGVYGTLISTPLIRKGNRLCAKSFCVQIVGGYDRCPCGTGTSARMALLYAQNKLKPGMEFEHASLLGTTFTGRILATEGDGIIPEIAGKANITGFYKIVVADNDPFPEGFRII